MLRDPVDAEGEVFQKSRVFLFCSQSQSIVDASLMSHKCVLEKNLCVGIESRHSIEQLVMVLLIDHQEFTVRKGFYIEFGDLIGQKAVEIGNPPAFKTELKHLLTALLIGRVGEQSPFFDEPETGADIPLLKQKLPSAQPFWTEAVSALIPLFICEISMFGNTTVEFFKHGLRDHRKFSKNRASPDAMPDPYTPSPHRPALAQTEMIHQLASHRSTRTIGTDRGGRGAITHKMDGRILFHFRGQPSTHENSAIRFPNHQRSQMIQGTDRKSTRLNSSHVAISYAVFCLKKKKKRGEKKD